MNDERRGADDDRRGVLRAIGIGALVFVAVMAFGAPRFFGGSGVSSPLVGQAAPAFAAEITAGDGAASHDRVSLESLRGNVVILDFWASWCQPCRTSIPIVGRVAAAHAPAGLVTLGINVESELPVARLVAAHRALEIPVPTIQDPNWQIQSAYGVESLPTLVLIDRTGVVRRVHTGVPEEAWLDEVVRELL
jgi:cytochrome c biogenesis protein CcmG/thiol:disulfide interchange protein DsbE